MEKSFSKAKAKCIVLMLILFFTSQIFAVPCGDFNSSGVINIIDDLKTAQYYVGLNPQCFDQSAAEVSRDGSITIVDALRIAQYYVGLIPSFEGSGPTPTPCTGDNCVDITGGTGVLRQWHQVILTFWGPGIGETDDSNPFLNYRLDVTFRNGGREIVVPGYFAADGDAANTSATVGDRWRVHFVPDTVGEWTFSTSFRHRTNISVDSNLLAGQPMEPDGITGSFTVLPVDKSGCDKGYQPNK